VLVGFSLLLGRPFVCFGPLWRSVPWFRSFLTLSYLIKGIFAHIISPSDCSFLALVYLCVDLEDLARSRVT
jgi:hypothetical protein